VTTHIVSINSLAENLYQDPLGIWLSSKAAALSYPEVGNDHCFQVEDNSFWFQHRNRVITSLLKNFPPNGAIFDVGGGNGCVAAAMERAGFAAVLVEPGPQGAQNGRHRGLQHVICSTVEAAGFRPESLPAVGLFDVLEHIEDQHTFLRTLQRVIIPNGKIYISVPAYAGLWSHDDVYAGHFRRYTRTTLAEALSQNGFEVEFTSYLFAPLILPIFLTRTLPTLCGYKRTTNAAVVARDHGVSKGLLTRGLSALLSAEAKLIEQRRPVPLGSSCLAVARRSKAS
jgi:SAM-dependent methyltransferase